MLGADGRNHFTPLLVNGKPVQNQTRGTTNYLFVTQGTGASVATNGAFECAVFDGTVYRLGKVVVTCTFPLTIVNKLKLTAATFYISGRNLWYLAPNLPKYTHFDSDNVVSGNTQGVKTGCAPSNIYVGDRRFEAFPVVGTGTGAGIRAMPFF